MGSQRPSREHRGEVRRRYEHPEARRSGVFAFLEAVCYNRYRTNVCRRRAEERRRSIMEHNFQQLLYTTAEENQNINAILKDESIWMTQKSMAELFGVGVPAINKHLSNIFEEGELEEQATISILEIVQQEGTRKVKRPVTFYNLDAIISVGYRVNSKREGPCFGDLRSRVLFYDLFLTVTLTRWASTFRARCRVGGSSAPSGTTMSTLSAQSRADRMNKTFFKETEGSPFSIFQMVLRPTPERLASSAPDRFC